MSITLEEKEIKDEEYREYEFGGRTYRINNPRKLITRVGGTTHRVVDAEGIVHCIPAVGQNGCALRWKPLDPKNPVQF